MPPAQLLGQPLDWLASAISAAGMSRSPGPLLALARTCRKMHRMACTQMIPRLRLKLETVEELGAGMQHVRALALAQATTSNLHLHLLLDQDLNMDMDTDDEDSMDFFLTAEGLSSRWLDCFTRAASLHSSLYTGQPPASPNQLQCITRVSLWAPDELALVSLVPDFLVQSCPSLRELTLSSITIPASTQPPTCTSLQTLNVSSIHLQGIMTTTFSQLLPNLPSLAQLSARSGSSEGVLQAAINKYSSQLKKLVLEEYLDEELLPWSAHAQFPQLQHLYVDLLEAGDAEMAGQLKQALGPSLLSLDVDKLDVDGDQALGRLMQAAPNLVSLSLGSIYNLQTSFAQVSCSWQELTLRDVYVADLAHLPLSSCTSLTCDFSFFLSSGNGQGPSPDQITAGVAAAQAVGGLQFNDHICISLYTDDLPRIAAASPLLKQLKGSASFELRKPGTSDRASWPEAELLLAAVGQHLSCSDLSVHLYPWSNNPGTLAQLPRLLPYVATFDCWQQDGHEDELVGMCRAATRPFTLRMLCGAHAYLVPQLQAAMQEAGHQLVTLVCE